MDSGNNYNFYITTMEDKLNEYGYRIDPAYLLDEVDRLSRRINRLTDIVCILAGAVVGILVAVILT